jgi:hypothetical protein
MSATQRPKPTPKPTPKPIIYGPVGSLDGKGGVGW